MRDRKNITALHNLTAKIAKNPTVDFDDALFHVLLEAALLGKETALSKNTVKDNGKEYLLLSEGAITDRQISFYDLFSRFVDEFVDYDGFVIDGIIIEKEFIEEIISSLDMSQISVVKDSIINFEGDAVVNAANNTLLGGGGVDGAIHKAAGNGLLSECRTLGGCNTGEAKITDAYDMKCSKIIHTVGPYYGDNDNDAELLASCYINSLELAKRHGLKSIAFPLISTGAYRYPLEEGIAIALESVMAYFEYNPDYPMYVVFYCYDDEAYSVFSSMA